jgi:hypothetical protein
VQDLDWLISAGAEPVRLERVELGNLAGSEPELALPQDQQQLPGYEWLFVLAGQLLLMLGERELRLAPGEVAEFDTLEPHWFGPSGDQPVEILHIFGPHGDKARVRARPAARP